MAACTLTPGTSMGFTGLLILHISTGALPGNGICVTLEAAGLCNMGWMRSKCVGRLPVQEPAQIRHEEGILHIRECMKG